MLETKRFYKFTKVCQILILTLWYFDPTLFPDKNSRNIAKSNRFFPGKGRGDGALILTYLVSPMAEIFPHYCLSFSISVIFRGRRVAKVGIKVQTLGTSIFHENLSTLNFYQTMFLFARVLPLVRISAILDHNWRSKGPKTSQKEPFHGC